MEGLEVPAAQPELLPHRHRVLAHPPQVPAGIGVLGLDRLDQRVRDADEVAPQQPVRLDQLLAQPHLPLARPPHQSARHREDQQVGPPGPDLAPRSRHARRGPPAPRGPADGRCRSPRRPGCRRASHSGGRPRGSAGDRPASSTRCRAAGSQTSDEPDRRRGQHHRGAQQEIPRALRACRRAGAEKTITVSSPVPRIPLFRAGPPRGTRPGSAPSSAGRSGRTGAGSAARGARR